MKGMDWLESASAEELLARVRALTAEGADPFAGFDLAEPPASPEAPKAEDTNWKRIRELAKQPAGNLPDPAGAAVIAAGGAGVPSNVSSAAVAPQGGRFVRI